MDTSHERTRRDFLIRGGKAAGLAALAAGLGFGLHRPERNPFAVRELKPLVRDLRIPGTGESLSIVRGEDPALLTRAALEGLGGIGLFIQPGDTVVVKPNVGWDRMPEQAANTNPEVVRVIVEECFSAGADRVIVTDVTCNETKRCFYRSGIKQAAEEAGATVEFPVDARYREVNMGGEMLGRQLVYGAFLEADKCINVPIAKHHSLTGVSLGMKNLYGILGGNRSRLHQDIHNSIADLGNFLRPTLVVMDAIRVLKRNGPQGGNLADVEQGRTIIASADPVAVDAYTAESFFQLETAELPYLELAERKGLGTSVYSNLSITEATV